MGETIQIETFEHDGHFSGYAAAPEGTPRAAIVVIQEIFGVNPGIRAKCDRLAKEGYLAIAPDLFWRIEPGIVLNPDVPEEFQQGLDYFKIFDQDKGVRDIEATIRAARAQLGAGGKVGAVGYCLGGRLAFMTATRTDADASVGYYGVGIDGLLGEAHAIARPVLLHFAGADHFVDANAIATVKDGLKANARATIHVYPGVDHGFATELGARRVPEAADLADSRTAAFFAEHLG
jgi:carboxymethylenebutenolidase